MTLMEKSHQTTLVKGSHTTLKFELLERDGQDDELWVHLPALGKTRRVVADGKRDAFMGAVLSYGDVLGHAPALWRHEISFEPKNGCCSQRHKAPMKAKEKRRAERSLK